MTTDHHQPHSVLSWKKIALLSGQNKKVIINYSVNVFFTGSKVILVTYSKIDFVFLLFLYNLS